MNKTGSLTHFPSKYDINVVNKLHSACSLTPYAMDIGCLHSWYTQLRLFNFLRSYVELLVKMCRYSPMPVLFWKFCLFVKHFRITWFFNKPKLAKRLLLRAATGQRQKLTDALKPSSNPSWHKSARENRKRRLNAKRCGPDSSASSCLVQRQLTAAGELFPPFTQRRASGVVSQDDANRLL